MLTRTRAAFVAAATVLGLLVIDPAAQADAPKCKTYDGSGFCLIWVGGPNDPGRGGGSARPPTGGGDKSSGAEAVVFATVDGQQCVPAGLSKPQPPKSEPVWGGHTDGAIYDCVVAPRGGGMAMAGLTLKFWAKAAPKVTPPDPATLARQAVSAMRLGAVGVGIVPEPRPGSVGLVGMPNWMWVDQPSARTWGPITGSASAGGFTVTATGKVANVTWDMGDGQVISCGLGTAYADAYGKSTSPTCGHVYTGQGTYTVQATSHWVITWSGIGQAGTIPLELTRAATMQIGEAQVLVQQGQ